MQHVLQSIPGLKVQIRVFLASLVQVDVLTFNMLLNVSRVKWIQAFVHVQIFLQPEHTVQCHYPWFSHESCQSFLVHFPPVA